MMPDDAEALFWQAAAAAPVGVALLVCGYSLLSRRGQLGDPGRVAGVTLFAVVAYNALAAVVREVAFARAASGAPGDWFLFLRLLGVVSGCVHAAAVVIVARCVAAGR